MEPAACALERITLSVTRRAGGPEAGNPPSTVPEQVDPRAQANAGQRRRGAGQASGRAPSRVRPGRRREGAAKLSDPSGRRAGAARGKSWRGAGKAAAGRRGERAGGRGTHPRGWAGGRAEGSAGRAGYWAARGRGCGRRCGRAGAAPRPGYESAAGRAPRGGNYGKTAGEGRGLRTFAISRPAAHSWHSWDPQEFSPFGSRGKRPGPCGRRMRPRGGAAPDLAGGRTDWERWERKRERPGKEKFNRSRCGAEGGIARPPLLPEPAGPAAAGRGGQPRDPGAGVTARGHLLSQARDRTLGSLAENLGAKDKSSSRTPDYVCIRRSEK